MAIANGFTVSSGSDVRLACAIKQLRLVFRCSSRISANIGGRGYLVRPNLLPIWVAVFIFLLFPALAFAQTQSDPTAFPFLSLDVSGLAELKGAFLVQWRLFHTTAIGESNQPSALYFLTLAATLCGALFIVFNRAAHTPKVYVSWLLLVVICLFGPYQSKLLFYPAVKAGDPIVSGIDPKTFCKEDTAACGFAP